MVVGLALSAVASIALSITLPISASELDLQPVRVTIDAPGEVEVLTLRNRGDLPVVIETRQVVWSQDDGVSSYASTRDLVVSPPRFRLEPGGAQMVRIGQRRTEERDTEGTYRIFFTEVPETSANGPGVSMSLSLAVPVFVAPRREDRANLEWDLRPLGASKLMVRLKNPGNRHVKLERLTLTENGSRISEETDLGYLLAGQQRHWTLDVVDRPKSRAATGARPSRITATISTQRGEESIEAPVAWPR